MTRKKNFFLHAYSDAGAMTGHTGGITSLLVNAQKPVLSPASTYRTDASGILTLRDPPIFRTLANNTGLLSTIGMKTEMILNG